MSLVRKYPLMVDSTCDFTVDLGREEISRDLRWINAEIALLSIGRALMVHSAKWARKRANTTESFCSDADKLSATSDRT